MIDKYIDRDLIFQELKDNMSDVILDNILFYIKEDDCDGKYENLDDDEITNSDEFNNILEEYINNNILDSIYNIKPHILDNKINIFRVIIVNESWIKDLYDSNSVELGVYWSWEKDSANPYWCDYSKNKTHKILLCATVDIYYVDWYETIIANSSDSSYDEKEIRVKHKSPITINEIYSEGSSLDLNIYKNITFYS